MSVAAQIEVRSYVAQVVEEELYAGSTSVPANTVTPLEVAKGAVPDGYEGVAVSVSVTQNAVSSFFLKVGDKEHYANGLNTAGLGGLTEETLLLVKIPQGKKWSVGLTNTSGAAITQAWRFRVRLFKK